MGSFIDITAADGGRFKAYMAVPASGSGPGIVLCQEIFGINAYVREVADSMPRKAMSCWRRTCSGACSRGVDLGYSPEEWQKAFDFFQKFDVDAGIKDIAADGAARCAAGRNAPARSARSATAWAASSPIWRRRAPASIARSAITASASKAASNEKDKIRCPMVLHFAGEDKYVPEGSAGADQGRLRRPAGCRDLCLSRRRTTPSPAPWATTINKPSADHGAFALDRAVPPRDGAAIRSLGAVGQALRITSSAPATSPRP